MFRYSFAPQEPQNLVPGSFFAPHWPQNTGFAPAACWGMVGAAAGAA